MPFASLLGVPTRTSQGIALDQKAAFGRDYILSGIGSRLSRLRRSRPGILVLADEQIARVPVPVPLKGEGRGDGNSDLLRTALDFTRGLYHFLLAQPRERVLHRLYGQTRMLSYLPRIGGSTLERELHPVRGVE